MDRTDPSPSPRRSSAVEPLGRRHRVTLPVRVDPTGRLGPTRHQATGPGWRRSSRGLYVPSDVPLTAAQRTAEVGVLLRSPRAAVTGWAGLAWRGARWVSGSRSDGSPRPVDVVADAHLLRPQALFRLSQERHSHGDAELVDGLRLATAAACVCFAMRYADSLADAVETLDMAYRADLVSPPELSAWLGAHPHRHGRAQAHEALQLGDENVWSPREVHARLAWQRASGVRPLTNRPVFDLAGRHVATPDLIDPVTGVCGEYDGDHHLTRAQRRRDLAREQRLRDHGLEPFTVVAGELGTPLAERLEAATARAARTAVAERRWTLEPPTWWVPTVTVEQRRALTPIERDIWLGAGRSAG